jgi:DNA-binding transcriptional ArsR family regulator
MEFLFCGKYPLYITHQGKGRYKIALVDENQQLLHAEELVGHFWLKPNVLKQLAKRLAQFVGMEAKEAGESVEKIAKRIEELGPKCLVGEKKAEHMEEVDPAILEKAKEFLKSPDILYQIKKVLDEGFIVDRYRAIIGEDHKKLLTYLIALSAKTEWPQNEWVTGDSGLGKTNLVKTVLGLFPRGYAKERAYLTSGGLRYGEQKYLVLYLKEFRKSIEQDVRLFSKEDGGYAFEIAIQNPETGEWTTQIEEIPAKTFITTSAESLPGPQLLRRVWLVSVDDTPDLTKEINKRKAEYREGKIAPVDSEKIEYLKKVVEILDPKPVVIPYASLLTDLAPWDRTSLDNLFDMISIIANLYQFQREVDEKGRIIATLADLYMAISISWPMLKQTLVKLPDRLKKCLEVLKELSKSPVKGLEGVTAKELARATGKAQSTIRGYLEDLVNLGYVYEDTSQRAHRYSPSGLSVEVLNSVDDVLKSEKWRKIVDFAKRSQEKAPLQSVEHSREKDKGIYVVDPFTGQHVDILSLGQSSTLPKEGSTGPESPKEGSKSDIGIFNTSSTLSTVPTLPMEEKIRRVFEIIENLEEEHIDIGYVAETTRVVEKAKEAGIPESSVNEIINQEIQRGHLFESRPGWIRRRVR